MKNFVSCFLVIILLLSCNYAVHAQENFWVDVTESSIGFKHDPKVNLPKQYRTLRLDTGRLRRALHSAPAEFSTAAQANPLLLMLPMPNGSFARFKIVQTAIMEPGLSARFSTIKTFGGQGIDDLYATIKLDWTAFGLHVQILSPVTGAVYIDPYSTESREHYLSYNKKDLAVKPFFDDKVKAGTARRMNGSLEQRTTAEDCVGGTLRQYRLAIACTWEYAVAVGGRQVTPAQALSAIVTTINRVDGVYESEVGIRMVLVDNNDKIIFTDSVAQPFKGNKDAEILMNESQQVIDGLIGRNNYDIGHTFSTGAGGYAGVGVVCDVRSKAQGVTGSRVPMGDPFNIDFVAHEFGHQFGANHTFNAATGNCGGSNGNSTTNVEPGSGSTIMGYAGICLAVNNLQPNSLPYFHTTSRKEILSFITSQGGRICAVPITTGNNVPIVNAGADFIIPRSTPFLLSGSGSDVDADPLSYSWEEVNAGGPFTDWDKPLGDAPIFRSFAPAISPVRYFPQLGDLVNNKTTIGEILPSYARILKFSLTARDNRAGGGGICTDETSITVAAGAGPFIVTSPNTGTTWNVGTFTTITWDVAKTNLAPVNCASVNIELSMDGGLTFPITLSSNTPNDGTEEIVVPNNITTKARVRVISSDNIFFDISNENFIIKGTSDLTFTFNNPVPVAACHNATAATVIHTNSINKFSTPISLSASGNPAGTTVVFAANPIRPGSSDSISLTGNIPAGIYNITITGTADTTVVSRIIQFTIGAPAKIPVTMLPAHRAIGVSLTPTITWSATPDAQFYTLQLSTSPTFDTSVHRIDNLADTSYKPITALSTNTEYYWRVAAKNACGAGPVSADARFKTAAIACSDTVYSKNVPLIIDTTINTITSTLHIPDGGSIQDINVVGLKGTHSYVGDITINLVSPSNTKVQLFKRTCSDDKNFNLNFDDQATAAISCPINDGQTSKPGQPLAAFLNENSTGTWKLEVIDSYADDGGSLTGWGLKICTYQAATLPVTWISFTANKTADRAVVLQWSVTNQIKHNYYEIEKSPDGVHFNYSGKIEAGKSTAVQQYVFHDAHPYAGNSFYRLKQVDKDQRYTYSSIRKVSLDNSLQKFAVYPNPAVDNTTVRVFGESKYVTIQVADVSGQIVFKRNAGPATAGQEFQIPVKGLSKGLYILNITTENGSCNERVIVQ
jgi:subtilisin-like proprotein convertase family protein